MRVLTVLTYYEPHWTGLTQIARAIAEGLAARGHEVTVLTSRHDPALPREETLRGVRIVRLWAPVRVSRGVLTPGFPVAAARLIRAADVVQMHTPLPEALLVAALCRLERRPLLMTHQGDLVMPEGAVSQAIERAGTGMMRAAARQATKISTHSRDYAEHSSLLSPFLGKLQAIYPPIDLPPPDPAAAERWRRELGLAEVPVVGFAGRWVEEKGFDNLLRSIPALAAAVPDARLVYAGQQSMGYERFYESCLRLLEPQRDRITFVGLVKERAQLANFYALCDVLAVPSRTDCFPAVQVEAMLSGTPVVVSDIPGARVPVRETGMGVLVREGDPEALADGIATVLRRRADFAAHGSRASEAFAPGLSIDAYERLLLGLARPR
jgi:glycosyltransferase involved in cell wall biosynthesis